MEQFIRIMQKSYLMSIIKILIPIIILSSVLYMVQIEVNYTLYVLAVGSLALHMKVIGKHILDIFNARKTLKELNITFVSSSEELDKAVEKIKKDKTDEE